MGVGLGSKEPPAFCLLNGWVWFGCVLEKMTESFRFTVYAAINVLSGEKYCVQV